MASRILTLTASLLLASSALARTDLAGCTYTDSVVNAGSSDMYATRVWYVPGTGELCEFLDCGGGRAPPKTTVPGCAAYEGTATYSPSFLDLATEAEASATSAWTASDAVTTLPTELITAPPSTKTAEDTISETASASESTSASEKADRSTTTVAPGSSSSSATTPGGPGATPLTTSTQPDAAAMPTAGAILGSCLIAGVAACVAAF